MSNLLANTFKEGSMKMSLSLSLGETKGLLLEEVASRYTPMSHQVFF